MWRMYEVCGEFKVNMSGCVNLVRAPWVSGKRKRKEDEEAPTAEIISG